MTLRGRPSKDRPHAVGSFQSRVLIAIQLRPAEAYSYGIAKLLNDAGPSYVPEAQVAVALKRMENRGIVARTGRTNGPAYRNRVLYRVTEAAL